MEKNNASGCMEIDQKLLEKYGKIDNFRELYSKLSSIPDSYEDFVCGVIGYAATSIYRKEKVMHYLEQNPYTTSSQVVEYIMRQPDFHDAAKQTKL